VREGAPTCGGIQGKAGEQTGEQNPEILKFGKLFPRFLGERHRHRLELFPMLTDAQCRNAICSTGAKHKRFADSGGLYLEVSAASSKRWFWKYRSDGKEGRLALGSYPAVGLRRQSQYG
jgi:hypothetical protein